MAEDIFAQGYVDIDLDSSVMVDGVQVSRLRMREPTVQDQLNASEIKGSQAQQEVWMMAALCDVAPDAIKSLKLRDYKKVQNYFLEFTG